MTLAAVRLPQTVETMRAYIPFGSHGLRVGSLHALARRFPRVVQAGLTDISVLANYIDKPTPTFFPILVASFSSSA